MDTPNRADKQAEYDAEKLDRLLASPVRPRLLSYGSETFPIRRQRLQTSRSALAEFAPFFQNQDGAYPWRLMFHPGTGLPAFLRLRLHRKLSGDDQQALEEAARLLSGDFEQSYRGWTSVIFGEGNEFGRSYRNGSLIIMGYRPAGLSNELPKQPSRHFTFQQHFENLPVIGGSLRLHEGVRDERVAVTSSFFPVADQEGWPPASSAWEGPELQLRALLSLFGLLDQVGRKMLFPLCLLMFAETPAGSDPGLIPVFLERMFADFGELGSLATYILERLRAGDMSLADLKNLLDKESSASDTRIEAVETEGSDQAILPFDGAYHQIRRYAIQMPQEIVWFCDVDVHTGEVLGGPWQEAIGAPYFQSSQEALAGIPTGESATVLSAADIAELSSIIQNAPALLAPGATNQTRTIAVHALRAYRYLTLNCGVDPAHLQGYAGHAPGLQVIMGGPTKFQWSSVYHPKRIFFDPSAQIVLGGGEIIYNQASDPEVVMHEFVHGLMWLLDAEPWDVPSTINPFAGALHEGYAMYLARSIAAPPGSGEDAKVWARGAYRQQKPNGSNNWKDRWALDRTASTAGADLLPAPNVYPSGIFSISSSDPFAALLHYDVGMVWARALWDLRKVLGRDELDWLAVQAYPYLHGYISSFELAAEALMEVDRQQRPTIDLTEGMAPVWMERGISAGGGIVGFAEVGGVLIAGSDAGVLQQNANVWQLQENNLNGQTLRGVTNLAADSAGSRFFAAAHLPTAATASSQKEWTPGIYMRTALNPVWSALGNWAIDTGNLAPLALYFHSPNTLLAATAKGVYQKQVDNALPWQKLGGAADMIHSLVGFDGGGGQTCLRGCGPVRMLRFGCGAANWLPEPIARTGDLGPQAKERLIRLQTCNNRVFLAALSGVYEVKTDWNTVRVAGTVQPVLAMAAQETAMMRKLFVATGNDLFEATMPISASDPMPALNHVATLPATVISLHVTAAGVIYAGTQAQGIHKWENGAWSNPAPPPAAHPPMIAANQQVLLRLHQSVDGAKVRIDLPPALQLLRVAQPGLPLRVIEPQIINGSDRYELRKGPLLLLVRAGNQAVTIAGMAATAAGDISITV